MTTMYVAHSARSTGVDLDAAVFDLPGILNLGVSRIDARIRGGSTSFGVQNHAGTLDNWTVSDAGIVTVRGGLTVSAGTTAVQALTATTGLFSGPVTLSGGIAGPLVLSSTFEGTTGLFYSTALMNTLTVQNVNGAFGNILLSLSAGVANNSFWYAFLAQGDGGLVASIRGDGFMVLTGPLAMVGALTGVTMLTANGATFTAAAPAVAAGRVGFGGTVAPTGTNGTGEAMKANVEGYLIVNVAGTQVKVPYVKN